MGEAQGKTLSIPKTAERTRNARLHGRFGVRGGRSASVFTFEAGKMAKNTNVLQKNGDKNSEKH